MYYILGVSVAFYGAYLDFVGVLNMAQFSVATSISPHTSTASSAFFYLGACVFGAYVRGESDAMSLPHATGHPNTYMAQASKNEWTTVLWKYAADCEWGDERAPQLSALVSNPSLCASA